MSTCATAFRFFATSGTATPRAAARVHSVPILAAIVLALAIGTPASTIASTSPVSAAPFFAAPYLTVDADPIPSGGAIGDLNGDCKPDLVVSSFLRSTVTVVLGDGRGGFGPMTEFATAPRPQSVAIGDLNGDGKPDLATANSSSSTVSVLLGNGDGTFGAKSDCATASAPVWVAIGDLNGDAKPDLALATTNASTKVSVLLGNGDGTFGARSDYGTGGGSRSVAVGDFNGDGKPDLATTSNPALSGPMLSVLLGNGDGTFGPNSDYGVGGGSSVAIGDLNGDGVSDVTVASPNAVSVLLGNGDGTFGPSSDYVAGGASSTVRSVAIGDLNLDGKPDLASANPSSQMISVLLGNGDGTFAGHNDYVAGGNLRHLSIGDLNGDSWPDLAASNTVLLGNGDGTFGRPVGAFATGEGPQSVATCDLNGDGKPDLVAANSNAGTLSVLLGNGDATFGARQDYGVGSFPLSVAIGDLNGDDKPDLATANSGTRTVSVLLGNGDGAFGPRSDYQTLGLAYSVAVGDLDEDHTPDLAVANHDYPMISVLHGNGDGTFGPRTDHETGSGPSCVAIADLNDDGKQDLATANEASHTLSVLLGNGDGTFGPNADYRSEATYVAIGDLNGDGKPDLATANGFSNTVSVLLGNGDGTFGPKTDYRTNTGGRAVFVAIADLNGDGKPDLATANLISGNTVSVLLGNGDGTFGARTEYGTGGTNPSSVAIADFNGDGKPDLAATNSQSNTVSVLINTGKSPIRPVPMVLTVPGTLNLRSMGHWLTAYLQPPCLAASTIDVGSIRLLGNVVGAQPMPVDPAAPTAIGDQNGDGVPDLMVKFDRAAAELTLTEGAAVPVTVTGTVAGELFSGATTIKVVRAHITAPTAGTTLNAGTVTTVGWEVPSGVDIQSVALLSSLDDGATWALEASGIPNSGSFAWTVPGTESERARVAVVLVESVDATGYTVEGVLGVSDAFRIVGTVDVGQGSRLEFALRGVGPNPAQHGLQVSFSLMDSRAATLALFDVSGRQISSQRVDALGAGWHTVTLGTRGSLPAGVYVIRLTQDGRSVTTRAVLAR